MKNQKKNLVKKNESNKKNLSLFAKTGTSNYIIPAIDALVALRPEYVVPWLLVRGFFGSVIDIQQEKVNDFVEFLKNNTDIFIKEIIETVEFQDGFVVTFEAYIKQRNKEKRIYIQNIFMGFTKSKGKINFEMERMYDTLNKMSPYQFHVLKKFTKYKKISINDSQVDIIEYDYEDIRLLRKLIIPTQNYEFQQLN